MYGSNLTYTKINWCIGLIIKNNHHRVSTRLDSAFPLNLALRFFFFFFAFQGGDKIYCS